MNLRPFLVIQLTVVLLLLSGQGYPQTPNSQPLNSDDPFAAKHRELLAKNPEGLSFTLQLKNKQVRFQDRKSTRLNSSHSSISYAVYCLKKKKKQYKHQQ